MGNLCCSGKEESKKDTAVFAASSEADDVTDRAGGGSTHGQQQHALGGGGGEYPGFEATADDGPASAGAAAAMLHPRDALAMERAAAEQEQARLVVQATGRAMVGVRAAGSMRRRDGAAGILYYTDQGFAAALAQHLEQISTAFPDRVPVRLPPISPKAAAAAASCGGGVLARLAQPEWEGIALGMSAEGGAAGCGGENPGTYMDHVAEQFLDRVVPKRERIFAKTAPMMDNLL
jgi:hypothetical protein